MALKMRAHQQKAHIMAAVIEDPKKKVTQYGDAAAPAGFQVVPTAAPVAPAVAPTQVLAPPVAGMPPAAVVTPGSQPIRPQAAGPTQILAPAGPGMSMTPAAPATPGVLAPPVTGMPNAPAAGYNAAQIPNAVRYEQPPMNGLRPPVVTPPAAPLDAQAATDRQALNRVAAGAMDTVNRVGAAGADLVTMPGRAIGGAYDTAVVRPARAMGVDIPYVSKSLVPAGYDPASATPYYDKIRQQDELAAQGGVAPGQTQAAARAIDNRVAAAAPVVPPATSVPAAQGTSAPGPYTVPGGGAAAPAPTVTTPDTDPAAVVAAANAPSGNVRREGNSYSGTNVAGPISVNGAAPTGGIVADGSFAAPGSGFQPGRSNVPATPLADAVIAANAMPQRGAVAGGPDPEAVKAAEWNRNRTQYLMEQAINHGFSSRKGNSNEGIIRSLAGQLGVQDNVAGRLMESAGTNQTNASMANLRDSGDTSRLGMSQTGENARAALRDTGETNRLGMREAGDNTRAANINDIARGRLAVEQGELGLRATAAGFQANAARRLEAAQTEMLNAKTPAEQRAAHAKVLALSGKDTPQRYTVVPGGQSVDASGIPHTMPSMVLDNSTGQFIQTPGAGAGGAPAAAQPPEGSMSKTSDGKAIKFVGGKWVAA